ATRRHTFGDFKDYDGLSLAFSADGKLLAVGGCGEIRLYDMELGNVRRRWPIKWGHVNAVEFSPNGKVLMAAGGRGTMPHFIVNPGIVEFWSVESGGEVMQFCAHDQDEVRDATFSPDGKLLAVRCDRYDVMKIWDVGAVTAGHSAEKK